MEDIKEQIIRLKLIQIKQIVAKDKDGDTFKLANRNKNIEFLIDNGLLIDDIKNIILNLEIKDYYKGPEEDRDGYEGEIWIFTPMFADKKIYVKIRIEKNILVVCISIHEYGKY